MAVYAERERISRELHDSVSQSLSYLYSQLEFVQEIMPKLSPEEVKAELASLAQVASVTFEEARDSIFSLRIAGGGKESLPTIISGCIRDFIARTGIKVELDDKVMTNIFLNPETEVQLVHILQEAFTNVTKHSRCTKVVIKTDVHKGKLWLTIQDNGEGFDPLAPRLGRRSFGLKMMQERAESINGTLEIQTCPGNGTNIIVSVPIGKIKEIF